MKRIHAFLWVSLGALILVSLVFAWRYRGLIRDGWRYLAAPRLSDAPAPTAIPLPALAPTQAATAAPASLTPNPTGTGALPPLSPTAAETPTASSPTQVLPPAGTIALPPGFGITVFAQGLDDSRMLAIGPDGWLYVAERGAGRIVRLPDRDGDGLADGIESVADGLTRPSSLAFFRDGSLYAAETERIWRLDAPDEQGVYRQREVAVDGLPAGGNHHTRTVLFSPDWRTMFVSIGSTCNVCNEADPLRAALVAYHLDPNGQVVGEGRVYAAGLRNAVGLAFRPGTEELWVTNNGRDLLGDDLPPETVYIVEEGGDHGWPHCHAGRIVDPDFGSAGACEGVVDPVVEMQAHAAPLGLNFYTGRQFPSEYQGDLFVAFHGSWNRSQPTGYKLVRIPIDDQGQPGPVQDFAVGWLRADGTTWGRPVDVITASDGSLYASDDREGIVYRIFYAP
ncbi:MAG: PQQ-dependent sugar dehydrogenase [Chloroflexota bacterium]